MSTFVKNQMKIAIAVFAGIIVTLFTACNSESEAQRIIDQVIENHGGDRYRNFQGSFDFRGRHYVMKHDDGLFQYERHFSNNNGEIKDVLNNQGFKRYLNGTDVTDTTKRAAAYARSVNSVVNSSLG